MCTFVDPCSDNLDSLKLFATGTPFVVWCTIDTIMPIVSVEDGIIILIHFFKPFHVPPPKRRFLLGLKYSEAMLTLSWVRNGVCSVIHPTYRAFFDVQYVHLRNGIELLTSPFKKFKEASKVLGDKYLTELQIRCVKA